MAKTKPKPPSPFAGHWRIVSMSAWEQDFIDEEEEGYIEFGDNKDQGQFHFGYVHGHMDCKLTTRDGEAAVEWFWDGNDENGPGPGARMGRGEGRRTPRHDLRSRGRRLGVRGEEKE